ncbi:MAG TPA: hypothetical protein DCO75_00560 [Fibrobacteres bacterium]|jgi:histidinol-phosphate aminotransferase|nr:hypothetical protein [Fibrobacterota bacterium]
MNECVQRHGSIPWGELRELGLTVNDISDFSATVNPFSLPEEIVKLITAENISAYPDTECHEAGKALAEHHKIPVECVQLTAGLTETIFLLPHLYKRAIQFFPTYGDYAAAYHRHCKQIESLKFPKSDSALDKTINLLESKNFCLLIICNPNNPDGSYLPICHIEKLCENLGHVTICVDESYQEMGDNCDSAIPLLKKFGNILILKSLTKPFGIGGLRAGYAVSSGRILDQIRQQLMPWGVSSLSQRIIPPLLLNYSVFKQQWKNILSQKQKMTLQLSEQGFHVVSGRCPFFLVNVKNAEQVRRKLLLENHVAVRSCASFGMPEWIRVMPGIPENVIRLLDILSKASV